MWREITARQMAVSHSSASPQFWKISNYAFQIQRYCLKLREQEAYAYNFSKLVTYCMGPEVPAPSVCLLILSVLTLVGFLERLC